MYGCGAIVRLFLISDRGKYLFQVTEKGIVIRRLLSPSIYKNRTPLRLLHRLRLLAMSLGEVKSLQGISGPLYQYQAVAEGLCSKF
jgi:hypothetical protein